MDNFRVIVEAVDNGVIVSKEGTGKDGRWYCKKSVFSGKEAVAISKAVGLESEEAPKLTNKFDLTKMA